MAGRFGAIQTAPWFLNDISLWIAGNVVFLSVIVLIRPFTTPRMINARCLSCGSRMRVSELRCQLCSGKFTLEK